MDAESKICRLIACDAGVLRFLGQTVFGARQRVKCFEWWRKGAAELAYCSEPGAVQQNPGAGPILPLKEESSAGR